MTTSPNTRIKTDSSDQASSDPAYSPVAPSPAVQAPPFVLWRNLNRGAGLVLLSLRRLRHYVGLNFLALIGVILAVGLVTSAGFFSQAVDTVVMRQELAEYSRITGKPPFSIRVFNSSTAAVPLSLEWATELGKGIATTLSQELNLPVSDLLLQANSGIISMRTERGGATSSTNVNVFYQDGIAGYMSIAQGVALDESAASGEQVDVWIHTRLVDKIGVDVGDLISLSLSSSEQSVPGRVAGVWQAADPKDAYWLTRTRPFRMPWSCAGPIISGVSNPCWLSKSGPPPGG